MVLIFGGRGDHDDDDDDDHNLTGVDSTTVNCGEEKRTSMFYRYGWITNKEEIHFMSAPFHPTILVLCTGNSCRSHIAEGYLRHVCGDKATIYSGNH